METQEEVPLEDPVIDDDDDFGADDDEFSGEDDDFGADDEDDEDAALAGE